MEITFNKFFNEELTIHEIQKAMEFGEISSKELVMYYLFRIAKHDQDGSKVNSILEINPDAIFIAEALDHERKRTGPRGPLHGIPVLLKDNIDTKDSMHTSAGTIALENNISVKDAVIVKKLRDAGAVILGKTNMTELANGMSNTMWAGYSSRGGQVLNPYGDADLFVGGSSSGSAVAVASNFTVLSVGTETDASILSPAVQNSVVGVYLDSSGLSGARIGVFIHGTKDFYESEEYDQELFAGVIHTLRDKGAIVKDVDIPSFHRDWNYGVMLYELKHSLDNYLYNLPPQSPVHSLAELIQFNKDHKDATLKYGQNKLELRNEYPNTLRNSEYLFAKLEDLYFSQQHGGIDFTLKKYNLDAILFPSYIGSTLCAKAGYPSIAVPAGYMKNGRPFGVTFASTAFSEGILIKIAYAFEQATKHRKSPILKK
ncbi:amidase family protein [Paenisporosarcina sp.]|uniref:amidase family protein n=1 Tax=Paenisporosarcina sp. TaxID=1932001 RepID=UPI003C77DC1D